MTKYYRVRTQEQWDWLMQWFEKQNRNIRWYQTSKFPTEFNYDHVCGDDIAVEEYEHEKLVYGDVDYYQNVEDVTGFIEVSQMMEESRMEDYVTIDSGDFDKIKFDRPQEDGNSFVVKKVNVMGYDTGKYVRDVELPTDLLIPKSLLYPKVPMTEAEKKEFDKLKDEISLNRHDLKDLLTRIKYSEDFPLLYHRLYVADGDGVERQLEFARAWADESLIEIIPDKKWNVKVPISEENEYYHKNSAGKIGTVPFVEEDTLKQKSMQFTAEELKQYGLDNDLFEKVEVSNVKED